MFCSAVTLRLSAVIVFGMPTFLQPVSSCFISHNHFYKFAFWQAFLNCNNLIIYLFFPFLQHAYLQSTEHSASYGLPSSGTASFNRDCGTKMSLRNERGFN